MSESERETTSEKKPGGEQKSENFIEAAWRWIKALDGSTKFLLTMIGVATVYFAIVDWRVRLLVKDPEFVAGLEKDPEFVAKVAQRVRPAIVFDAGGSLLADAGAYKLLEGVPEVELDVKDETVKSVLPHTFTLCQLGSYHQPTSSLALL